MKTISREELKARLDRGEPWEAAGYPLEGEGV
jgi:hypothetical protein